MRNISFRAHSQRISLPKLPFRQPLSARGIPQRLVAVRWVKERVLAIQLYRSAIECHTCAGKSFVFTASSAYISQVCAPITSKGSPTPPGDVAFFVAQLPSRSMLSRGNLHIAPERNNMTLI
jgi:hypothetical protein